MALESKTLEAHYRPIFLKPNNNIISLTRHLFGFHSRCPLTSLFEVCLGMRRGILTMIHEGMHRGHQARHSMENIPAKALLF